MTTWKHGIAPYLKVLLSVMFLLSREPHLSGALLILGVGAVLMFVGGISWKWGGLAAAVGGFQIARQARDRFGSLLVVGIISLWLLAGKAF